MREGETRRRKRIPPRRIGSVRPDVSSLGTPATGLRAALDGLPLEEAAGSLPELAAALATPSALFEIYQGEVFKSAPADFDAVDEALAWLTVVDQTAEHARDAASLQQELQRHGSSLSARDAFIAGTAYSLSERLVVADSDFDVAGLTDLLAVDFLRRGRTS